MVSSSGKLMIPKCPVLIPEILNAPYLRSTGAIRIHRSESKARAG
jgi:hypothetical protein